MLLFKSIKSKLLFSFSLVILLVIILGVYNNITARTVNTNTSNIINEELQLLIADQQLATTMANRIGAARGYVLFGDSDLKDRFNGYTETGRHYEEIAREIGVSEGFDELIEKTVQWRTAISEDVFNEYDNGNEEIALKNLSELTTLGHEIAASYEDMALDRERLINEKGQAIIASGENTLFIVLIVTIVVVILSIIAALFTSTIITKPIITVMERMKLIASGDLSQKPLATKSRDEVGQLVAATNEMSVQINRILFETLSRAHQVNTHSANLKEATSLVSDSSNQIAATMEQLAAGSEAQANTASNMAEMVGNFFEDVQHANEASNEVVTASNSVLQRTADGNDMMASSVEQMNIIYQVVNESVERIQNLDNQTKEISELVTVISEIAAQTNLLALNAAIEAARAGEQGKGFAVVAEEVKKLAEQVATSVSEITVIVDTVQEVSSSAVKALENGYHSVADGKQKVIDTGQIFEEITGLVTNMNKLTNEMSDDLNNIEEVGGRLTEGVTEVASIAEESAAGVEETTASVEQSTYQIETISGNAEELVQLSNDLEKSVNQFTIASIVEKK